MIVKGNSVIGLNVTTIDTGTVIETVDDIAYNPETHRVEALLVSSGGLFSSAKAISMDDVRNVGENAVMVPDASVMKPVKELGDSVRSIASSNKHLVKTNVVTIDGKELGKVTDIYFDSENGDVESMEVSQGGLKTLTEGKKSIKSKDIVTIGADATIVSTYTEMVLEQQGEEGGLKGAFNDAREKAAEMTETAKTNAQEFGENARVKAEEIGEKTKQRAAEARENIDERVESAHEYGSEKMDEASRRAEEIRQDVSERGQELQQNVNQKANELKAATDQKSVEVRDKADELAREARKSSRELKDTAEDGLIKTRAHVEDAVETARKRGGDGAKEIKQTVDAHKSGSVSDKGREVVSKAKETIKDVDHEVTIETKAVSKKK